MYRVPFYWNDVGNSNILLDCKRMCIKKIPCDKMNTSQNTLRNGPVNDRSASDSVFFYRMKSQGPPSKLCTRAPKKLATPWFSPVCVIWFEIDKNVSRAVLGNQQGGPKN
jgi:hypothetical protein